MFKAWNIAQDINLGNRNYRNFLKVTVVMLEEQPRY